MKPIKTTYAGRNCERGAALFIVLMISLAIVSIIATIVAMKISREAKERELARRHTTTVKCKRAIDEVVKVMEIEKRVKGSYPREFNEEFLNRYQTIDRWIINSKIWSPAAGGELELDTAFGEYYELTGWCRDGYVYTYDSDDRHLDARRYTLDDLKGDSGQ